LRSSQFKGPKNRKTRLISFMSKFKHFKGAVIMLWKILRFL
jgi:hypothetical protein